MKKKILIADDESRIRILVTDFLESEGYEVISASDGKQALDLFYENEDCKLMILDVMMPYYDGFQIVKEIRSLTKIPILMLTARTSDYDELQGFHLGVDDYIRKPFSPKILVARINALFDRTYGEYKLIEKGRLQIQISRHLVIIDHETINLSQTEFQLLLYLVENEGIVLSREQILYKVWGLDYDGTERTVDTHMNRLRNKLEQVSSYIQTIRGFGYRFEVKT